MPEEDSKANWKECPYEKACWFSRTIFWWLNPLFHVGYKRKLTPEDIDCVLAEDESSILADKLDRCWQLEIEKERCSDGGRASLMWAVLKAFRWDYTLPGLYLLISEILRVLQPFLIGKLVNYFQPGSDMESTEVYLYAVFLGLSGLGQVMVYPRYIFLMSKVAMQMKAATGALIYRKVLRMSSLSLHHSNIGQVVNLMSSDLETFNYTPQTFHFIWIAPIETMVVLYLMYHNVGVAALLTLVVLFSMVPLQAFLGRLFGKLRKKIGYWTDKRIHAMNEIVSGIRVIKMYCWEKPFSDMVAKLRRREVRHVWRAALAKSFNMELFLISSRVLALCVFLGAWHFGAILTTGAIFSAFGWLEALRVTTFLYLFSAIEKNSILFASLKRIQKFLVLNELEESEDLKKNKFVKSLSDKNMAVCVSKMTAPWIISDKSDNREGDEQLALLQDRDQVIFSLKNVSLDIQKGELMAIAGMVGAGKSSLLLSILGELPPAEGTVEVNGIVGYVSQQPWVFSGTIRDNILFGAEYDAERYKEVIFVCALNKDMEQMPHGDLTLVGEKGLLLSGGQKARITLARSIFRVADIYLLDDPLSAVDTNVGRHIFDRCICDFLGNSTRILVTHQLQYLSKADRIVIMKEGSVIDIGSQDQLTIHGLELSQWTVSEEEEEEEENDDFKNVHAENDNTDYDIKPEAPEIQSEEERSEGSVDKSIYWRYIKAGIPAISIPLCLSLNLSSHACGMAADWFLAKWSEAFNLLSVSVNHVTNNTNTSNMKNAPTIYQPCVNCSVADVNVSLMLSGDHGINSPEVFGTLDHFIHLYLTWSCVYLVLVTVCGCFFYSFCILSNCRLHDAMFRNVLGAKPRFFDINPIGRILNRFARDITFMDDLVPQISYAVLDIVMRLLSYMTMTCVINPWMLLPLTPLAVFVFLIRHFAIQTTRETKRIEAAVRSPVFSHVSDTMLGLQTVRALGRSERFIADFDKLQNSHTSAWFHHLSAFNWLIFYSSLAVVIYLNFMIYLSIFLKDALEVSSGLIALSLTYTILFADPFAILVRLSTQLEDNMTSVERVISFTNLEQEAPKKSEHPPPDDWPHSGSISLTNLCLQYAVTGPVVLRNINCSIKSKEKVGIVGRTGAGKSSLLSAIFRLAEPAGIICIDGIDVLKIGLHELREKISVIPQDPVLFSGSLRRNLDPFNEHPDEKLWKALEQVQLKNKVKGMDGQLNTELSESGQNFSVGQRQLVCLARAILRYNKILILDEATANVDHKTDSLIQQTVRDHFRDCTVLTIAHRLHTIMDSDRVMVLDMGEMKEFDSPYSLLQNKDGVFTNLVELTGKAQETKLRALATAAHQQRESTISTPIADMSFSDLFAALTSTTPCLESTSQQPTEDADERELTSEQPTEDAEAEELTSEQHTEDAEAEELTSEQPTEDAEAEELTSKQPTEDAVVRELTSEQPTEDAEVRELTSEQPTEDAEVRELESELPTEDAGRMEFTL